MKVAMLQWYDRFYSRPKFLQQCDSGFGLQHILSDGSLYIPLRLKLYFPYDKTNTAQLLREPRLKGI
jgi:hypothetical protein